MFLLRIAIEALALMVLLRTLSDEDLEFSTAAMIAAVTSIGTTLLALGLAIYLGASGVVAAAILAAAALGVVVSTAFGLEINRAFLVSGVFMVIHLALTFGASALWA